MAQLRLIYLLSFLLLLNSCTSKLKFLVAKSLNVAEEYAVLVGGEVELKPSGGIEPYTLSILPVSCANQLSVAEKKTSCGEVIREQVKPGVYTYKYKATTSPNEIYIALTDGVSIKEPIILLVHVVKPVEIEPKSKSMIIGRSININGLYGLKPYTYKITAGSENGDLVEIPGSTAVELKAKGLGTMKITVQDKMGNTADASIEVKDELKIFAPPLMVQTNGNINITAEGGIPPYTFSATGGTLTVISNVATATGPASVKLKAPNSPTSIPVKVTDSEGNVKSLNISVYAPIAISPTTLMIAKNGTYKFNATGGVEPYAFSTTCGSDASIDANGNFKAPASTKSCQVKVSFSLTAGTVTGTATANVQVTENFTMSVSSVEMMVGNSFDLSTVMNGGAAPYKCTAVSITGKGTLTQKSGSTNTNCVFNATAEGSATVKITDSSTTPMSVDLPITIYPVLTLTPATKKIAVNNSLNFTTTGGVGTKTLIVKSGSGSVSGMTYTAGNSTGTVIVEASDAFNPANKVTATITVNPALKISPLTSYVLSGQTKQFTATGGDEVYTYSLDSTTFATINPATGLVTAKATTNPVDVQVRVKDGMNNQVSTMLNIVPELKISPARIALAVNSSKFTFQASGGKANYNFSLPTAKGTISSDPVAGKFSYTPSAEEETLTLTVTDSAGQTATADLIIYKPLLITPDPLTLKVGQSLSNITITGGIKNPTGQPPYTLTLNTTEFGNISGTNPYTFTATNKSGVAKLTITDNPEFAASNVTKDITVLADLPKSLQLTGVDAMKAGECQPYDITLIDQFGNIANANNKQYNLNLTASLVEAAGESVANNGAFFVDKSCSLAGTTTFIDSVSTSRTVYFKAARAGKIKLIATHSNAAAIGVDLKTAEKQIQVNLESASRLVFLQSIPSQVPMNADFNPALKIAVADLAGNVVPNQSATIALSFAKNAVQSELIGTLQKMTNTSVAEFADVSINGYGQNFQLKASANGLQDALSNEFNVQAVSRVLASPSLLPSDGEAVAFIHIFPRENNGDPVNMSGKEIHVTANSANVTFPGYTSCTVSGGMPCAIAKPQSHGNYLVQAASTTAGLDVQFTAVVKSGASNYLTLQSVARTKFDSSQFVIFSKISIPKCNVPFGGNSYDCEFLSVNGQMILSKASNGAYSYANYSFSEAKEAGKNIYIKNWIPNSGGWSNKVNFSNLNSATALSNLGHVYILNSTSYSSEYNDQWPSGVVLNAQLMQSLTSVNSKLRTPINSQPIQYANTQEQYVQGYEVRDSYTDPKLNTPLNVTEFCNFTDSTNNPGKPEVIVSDYGINISCAGMYINTASGRFAYARTPVILNGINKSKGVLGGGRIAIKIQGNDLDLITGYSANNPTNMSSYYSFNNLFNTGANSTDYNAGTIYYKSKSINNGVLLVSNYYNSTTTGRHNYYQYSTYLPAIKKAKIKSIIGNQLQLTFSTDQRGLKPYDPNQLNTEFENYFSGTQVIDYQNPDDLSKIRNVVANDFTSITVDDASVFQAGQEIQTIYVLDYLDVRRNGYLRTDAFVHVKKSIVGCSGDSCFSGSTTDDGVVAIEKYNARGILTKVNNVSDFLRLGSGKFSIPNFNQLHHDLYGSAYVVTPYLTQDFPLIVKDQVTIEVTGKATVNSSVEIKNSSQLIVKDFYIKEDLNINAANSETNSYGLITNTGILVGKVDGNLNLNTGAIFSNLNYLNKTDIPAFLNYQGSRWVNQPSYARNISYAGNSQQSYNYGRKDISLPPLDNYRDPKYPGFRGSGIWLTVGGYFNLNNGQIGNFRNLYLTEISPFTSDINLPYTAEASLPPVGSSINIVAQGFGGNGVGKFQMNNKTGGRLALRARGTKSDFSGKFDLSNLTALKAYINNAGFPMTGLNSNSTDPVYATSIYPESTYVPFTTKYYTSTPGAGTTFLSASDMPNGMLLIDNKMIQQAYGSGITTLPAFDKYFYKIKSIDVASKKVTLTESLPVMYRDLLIGYQVKARDQFGQWRNELLTIKSHQADQIELESIAGLVVGDDLTVYHKLDYLDISGGSVLQSNGYVEVLNQINNNNSGSVVSDGLMLMFQNQFVGQNKLTSINSAIDPSATLKIEKGNFYLDQVKAKSVIINSNKTTKNYAFAENGQSRILPSTYSYLFVRDSVEADDLTLENALLSINKLKIKNDLNVNNTLGGVKTTEIRGLYRFLGPEAWKYARDMSIQVDGKMVLQSGAIISALASKNEVNSIQPRVDFEIDSANQVSNAYMKIKVAGDFVLDGNINSVLSNQGGGAIYVESGGQLSGNGQIIANGGKYNLSNFGTYYQPGGRIHIKAKTLAGGFQLPTNKEQHQTLMTRLQAYGQADQNICDPANVKEHAQTGMILIQSDAMPNGVLYVEGNNGTAYTHTSFGKTNSGVSVSAYCQRSSRAELAGFKGKVSSVSGDQITLTMTGNMNGIAYANMLKNVFRLRNLTTKTNLSDWTKDPIVEVVSSVGNSITVKSAQDASMFKANDEVKIIYIFDYLNVGGSAILMPKGESDIYVHNKYLGDDRGSVNGDGIIAFEQSSIGGALATNVNNGIDHLTIDRGNIVVDQINSKQFTLNGGNLYSRNSMTIDTLNQFTMKGGMIATPSLTVKNDLNVQSGYIYVSDLKVDGQLTLGDGSGLNDVQIVNGYLGQTKFTDIVNIQATKDLIINSDVKIIAGSDGSGSSYGGNRGQSGLLKTNNYGGAYISGNVTQDVSNMGQFQNLNPIIVNNVPWFGIRLIQLKSSALCKLNSPVLNVNKRVSRSIYQNLSPISGLVDDAANNRGISAGGIQVQCGNIEINGNDKAIFEANGGESSYSTSVSYENGVSVYNQSYSGAGGGGRISLKTTGAGDNIKIRRNANENYQTMNSESFGVNSVLLSQLKTLVNVSGGANTAVSDRDLAGTPGTIALTSTDHPDGYLIYPKGNIATSSYTYAPVVPFGNSVISSTSNSNGEFLMKITDSPNYIVANILTGLNVRFYDANQASQQNPGSTALTTLTGNSITELIQKDYAVPAGAAFKTTMKVEKILVESKVNFNNNDLIITGQGCDSLLVSSTGKAIGVNSLRLPAGCATDPEASYIGRKNTFFAQ